MSNNIKTPWLVAAYRLFAQEGPQGLKVEVIARAVQKSKSSFYHHFADLEAFTELLLEYHLENAKLIAEKEKACKKVDPDLLLVMVEHKEDLLFNRQIRINRHLPLFQSYLAKTNQISSQAILGIWAEALGLSDHSFLAQMVLNLSLENFFLQITPNNLNYDWLSSYMKDLQTMVKAIKNTPNTAVPPSN